MSGEVINIEGVADPPRSSYSKSAFNSGGSVPISCYEPVVHGNQSILLPPCCCVMTFSIFLNNSS